MTKMRTMTIRARVTVVVLAALLAGCASGGSGNTESSQPEAGPREVPPRPTNTGFFERLMEREYPPELRRAGIGGKVTVWLKLDTEGRVQEASVKDGSGYTQLDAIAVRIARQLRFTPALYDGKPVSVTIAIPVTFSARNRVRRL